MSTPQGTTENPEVEVILRKTEDDNTDEEFPAISCMVMEFTEPHKLSERNVILIIPLKDVDTCEQLFDAGTILYTSSTDHCSTTFEVPGNMLPNCVKRGGNEFRLLFKCKQFIATCPLWPDIVAGDGSTVTLYMSSMHSWNFM